MQLTYKEWFVKKRQYQELIDTLECYFEKTEFEETKNDQRIVDLNEVKRLNDSIGHCIIEKTSFVLRNENKSLTTFMNAINDYEELESSISELDENDKAEFESYLTDLKNDISELTESCKNCLDGKVYDKDDCFQSIIDTFKNKIIEQNIIGRFVHSICEKYSDSYSYKHLLESVNRYLKKIGVYTDELNTNWNDCNLRRFKPQNPPEYTTDKRKHNLIKDIIRLPYLIDVIKDENSKQKSILVSSGEIICYSNKIQEK